MRKLALGLGLLVAVHLGGCLQPQVLACGDVQCPSGWVCTGRNDLPCVEAAPWDACHDGAAARDDGTSCSTAQIVDGVCLTGLCVPAGCGDGVFRDGERCDAGESDGSTCVSVGFYRGELACDPDTCGFDISACTGTCGDGVLDVEEPCEEGAPIATTCRDLGAGYRGALSCAQCRFDTTGCTGTCGDAVVDVDDGELCDEDLARTSCLAYGFDAGLASCADTCAIDFRGCEPLGWQPVTNLAVQDAEVAPDGALILLVDGVAGRYEVATRTLTNLTSPGMSLLDVAVDAAGAIYGVGASVGTFDVVRWADASAAPVAYGSPQGPMSSIELLPYGDDLYLLAGSTMSWRRPDGTWAVVQGARRPVDAGDACVYAVSPTGTLLCVNDGVPTTVAENFALGAGVSAFRVRSGGAGVDVVTQDDGCTRGLAMPGGVTLVEARPFALRCGAGRRIGDAWWVATELGVAEFVGPNADRRILAGPEFTHLATGDETGFGLAGVLYGLAEDRWETASTTSAPLRALAGQRDGASFGPYRATSTEVLSPEGAFGESVNLPGTKRLCLAGTMLYAATQDEVFACATEFALECTLVDGSDPGDPITDLACTDDAAWVAYGGNVPRLLGVRADGPFHARIGNPSLVIDPLPVVPRALSIDAGALLIAGADPQSGIGVVLRMDLASIPDPDQALAAIPVATPPANAFTAVVGRADGSVYAAASGAIWQLRDGTTSIRQLPDFDSILRLVGATTGSTWAVARDRVYQRDNDDDAPWVPIRSPFLGEIVDASVWREQLVVGGDNRVELLRYSTPAP